MIYRKREKGFTLVELAIVLTVIGLLIAGVLKGQEIVDNARLTSMIRQMEGYKAAVHAFKAAYDGLPGDIVGASTRLPNCQAAPNVDPCASTHGKAFGNGRLDWYQHSPATQFSLTYPFVYHVNSLGNRNDSSEWLLFWVHLARSGLIKEGDMVFTGTSSNLRMTPEAPLQGRRLAAVSYTGARQGDAIMPSTWLTIGPRQDLLRFLTPKQVQYIDEKLDDGRPFSGRVRANSTSHLPAALVDTECATEATNSYNLTSVQQVCNVVYNIEQ